MDKLNDQSELEMFNFRLNVKLINEDHNQRIDVYIIQLY